MTKPMTDEQKDRAVIDTMRETIDRLREDNERLERLLSHRNSKLDAFREENERLSKEKSGLSKSNSKMTTSMRFYRARFKILEQKNKRARKLLERAEFDLRYSSAPTAKAIRAFLDGENDERTGTIGRALQLLKECRQKGARSLPLDLLEDICAFEMRCENEND